MTLRYPSYYKQFHCIANLCKSSCCAAGWEIDIDEQTASYYNSISGNFGKLLRENIAFNTKSPSYFKLKQNGRCPFFNSKNLCDIYTNLGENHLCEICKEHPRFYEFFEDVTECGIGLYCEEAARIILSQTESFSTYDIPSKNKESDSYEKKLYKFLCRARAKIFYYLESTEISITSKMKSILWYAYTLQQNIDSDLLDDEEIFEISSDSSSNILPIIDYLSDNLEPNDPYWPLYLKSCCKMYEKNLSRIYEFEKNNPHIENYLKNISIYFVYRYFLKATFDKDVLSKVKLMVISIAALKFLYFCKWLESNTLTLTSCVEITRKFSEEIECSDDTLLDLADSSYNLDIFSTEYLINLF